MNGAIHTDKLSITVHSGAFDRVHYALLLAAAAAAVNRPVTLFFTMAATRALAKPTADGVPGWQRLTGGDMAAAALDQDKAFAAAGIAGFEELLESSVALGVRFLVCEAGLLALGLQPGDLRSDVPTEVTGAVSFLADASPDGITLFV
jgi:peroxiredoxin family protein